MRFRPKLVPTLFTVPSLIVLVWLGMWQLERLEWKEELIDRLQSRAELPPRAFPAGPLDEEQHEFLPVEVTGVLLHEHEFHLINRSLNGNPGVHVVTPLRRSDDGSLILVNRGWTPFERRDPATRMEGQIDGEVTVAGLLRFVRQPGTIQGWVMPENEPHNNAWFWLNTEEMAASAGLDALPDYYVFSADRNVPGGYPLGEQWRLDLRNDHLHYAITWFGLAIGLAVIYVVYHWRRPGR